MKFDVKGIDKLPKKGALIAANHQSAFELPSVATSAGPEIRPHPLHELRSVRYATKYDCCICRTRKNHTNSCRKPARMHIRKNKPRISFKRCFTKRHWV